MKPKDGGGYLYVYQYKDHLGNVRLSYADLDGSGTIESGSEILEEKNYYPFGLKHNNNALADYSAVNKFKYAYNGKELNDELRVDLYDFGARNYDPALGRWLNVDPLAENSRRWTPYNYAYNNPIYFIDPDGMQAVAGLKMDELDGWRKDLQTGEMSYDDSFTSENTAPSKYEYSDGGWDDKYVYETNGTKTMTDEYMYDQAFGPSKVNIPISTLGRGNGNADISLLNDNMTDALKYDLPKDYKMLVMV